MENRLFRLIPAIILAISSMAGISHAQYFPYGPYYGRQAPSVTAEQRYHGSPTYNWSLGFKKFFNSYTSYQFPNPFPPHQDPLSRLEFPIDQWFVKGGVDYKAPHWSLVFDAAINISGESALNMQDSDWEDDTDPFQKTIFSESDCRLDKGILIDSKLLFYPPYFRTNLLKASLGYRYQEFHFTTHDGDQQTITGHVTPLPGDGIEFMQKFFHIYFGGELNFNIHRIFRRRLPSPIKTTIRGDYAIVDALNEDLHLLRLGERITREDTLGHCWRIGLTTAITMNRGFSLELDADFKRIVTHGDHKLMNAPLGVYFRFNGSEVWSDQLNISMNGKFRF
jgi:hypothetical protein